MAGQNDTYCTGLGCKQHHRGMEVVHYIPEENMGDEVHVPEGMRLVKVEDLKEAMEYSNKGVRELLGKYIRG